MMAAINLLLFELIVLLRDTDHHTKVAIGALKVRFGKRFYELLVE